MVAEVVGETNVTQWRRALDLVYQRTPLLASGIVEGTSGGLTFIAVAEPMPLGIGRYEDSDWKALVADEEDLRLDPSRGAIGRATLSDGAERSRLLLSIDYAPSDAFGAVNLLREILRALVGEPLEAATEPGTVEHLTEQAFVQPLAALQSPDGSLSAPLPAQFRSSDAVHPSSEGLALSISHTERLLRKARAKGTTVQGALGVSAMRAMMQLVHALSDALPGVASAINLWEMARAFIKCVRPLEQLDGIGPTAGVFLPLAAAIQLNAEMLAKMVREQLGFEISLCSLGIIQNPREYGGKALKLASQWGPSGPMGFEGEQMVRVNTVNGRIHLLHTIYAAAPGLLQVTVHMLETAVS
jgi:hypothetical protein